MECLGEAHTILDEGNCVSMLRPHARPVCTVIDGDKFASQSDYATGCVVNLDKPVFIAADAQTRSYGS